MLCAKKCACISTKAKKIEGYDFMAPTKWRQKKTIEFYGLSFFSEMLKKLFLNN